MTRERALDRLQAFITSARDSVPGFALVALAGTGGLGAKREPPPVRSWPSAELAGPDASMRVLMVAEDEAAALGGRQAYALVASGPSGPVGRLAFAVEPDPPPSEPRPFVSVPTGVGAVVPLPASPPPGGDALGRVAALCERLLEAVLRSNDQMRDALTATADGSARMVDRVVAHNGKLYDVVGVALEARARLADRTDELRLEEKRLELKTEDKAEAREVMASLVAPVLPRIIEHVGPQLGPLAAGVAKVLDKVLPDENEAAG